MLLFGLWLILSGRYDAVHIAFGIISVILVMALNHRVYRLQLFKGDVPSMSRLHIGRFICFIPWLLCEIVRASLQVARVVLHPRMPINPSLLRFRVNMPCLNSAVMLGNCITLTPGTVTIELKDNEFLVHALLDESAAGLINGTMQTHVARLFQKSPSDIVSEVKVITSVSEM